MMYVSQDDDTFYIYRNVRIMIHATAKNYDRSERHFMMNADYAFKVISPSECLILKDRSGFFMHQKQFFTTPEKLLKIIEILSESEEL